MDFKEGRKEKAITYGRGARFFAGALCDLRDRGRLQNSCKSGAKSLRWSEDLRMGNLLSIGSSRWL
jgi:hypothetical protein